MRKIIFILVLLVLFMCSGFAATAPGKALTDVLKADSILVKNGRLLVGQGAEVYVYSLKDLKLLKKFGKAGEGPKEFKVVSYGSTQLFLDSRAGKPGQILVSSVGKLSLFTPGGEYIKEFKTPQNFHGNRFYEMGQKYAGMGSATEAGVNYMTVNIYDKNLNKEKEIKRWDPPFKPGKGTRIFTSTRHFTTYGGKAFVTASNGLNIDVYDQKGNKEYSITKEYKRLRVTSATKKEVIHFLKTSPMTKDVFQYIQPITFEEFYPTVRSFFVKDNKVYVLTFQHPDGKNELTECLVFSLKGKYLKTVVLNLKHNTPIALYPYDINGGKLYQLVEDEDEEEWRLDVKDIK